ncbi:hypothetical protein HBA54_18900 [Pelagibius litoralis]|uniref:Uncharacterized protein n=1 Tax=Pelagibius litoralis TaxID=374515 RepID=A0A967F071_9PROT|nr:hypothetical protein [Pelagibius litoralis]NIA70670.1 hypothetical protein [Pelagibius litoralis]
MLLATGAVGALVHPATACTVGWPYEPEKPFSEAYLQEGYTLFRGTVVDYEVVGHYGLVSFAVTQTYRGLRERAWRAVWANSTFGVPKDLDSFKVEVGKDLVVALRDGGGFFDPKGITLRWKPVIVQDSCREPAMQKFVVMEPVLKKAGLID